MPYPNLTNQTLPIPSNLRGSEETNVRNYLNYYQAQLNNFFNGYLNRATGGTGLDSQEIASKAIKSDHIDLTTGVRVRTTSWTGNNYDYTANNQNFILYTFAALCTRTDSKVDIRHTMLVGCYQNIFYRLVTEKQSTPFLQTSGTILTTNGLETVGWELPPSGNRILQYNFIDNTPMTVGLNYYRVILQSNIGGRVYNEGDSNSNFIVL